jgi:DNA polymerase (family 10)
LRRQGDLIDTLNQRGDLPRLFKGLEADILPDGTLDVPDECRADLDYVVASVHSTFRLSKHAQTERVISAVRDPSCRVLGHPTGRLLLARPGYEIDLDRVLEACADNGVAAEINASPYRLDLDHVWARKAIALGVDLIVNPDAHSTVGLEDVRWGIMVARRAGASASEILNCGDMQAWIRDR